MPGARAAAAGFVSPGEQFYAWVGLVWTCFVLLALVWVCVEVVSYRLAGRRERLRAEEYRRRLAARRGRVASVPLAERSADPGEAARLVERDWADVLAYPQPSTTASIPPGTVRLFPVEPPGEGPAR